MKKLGFGCMRFPMRDGRIDMDQLKGMVDTFMGRGFTYYDTSYVNHGGESEKALKEALVGRYPRDSFTITTKSPVFMVGSREDFLRIFDEQLGRLGTDYVDYYWLHAINRTTYQTVQDLDLVGLQVRLRDEGKIRHIGLSYHDSPELLDQILTDHPELEIVQLQLNYFDWDSPYVAARACYEVCARHGAKVVVMEPVKGGELMRLPEDCAAELHAVDPHASLASWAIRWAASLPEIMMVLSGMSNQAQMDDNTSFMQDFVPMGEAEEDAVAKVAARLRANPPYDVEALRKAEALCPKRIGLARIGQMLNDHELMGGHTNTCVYYGVYLDGYGKAANCDGCGRCLEAAGGLDVPALMRRVDKTITHF